MTEWVNDCPACDSVAKGEQKRTAAEIKGNFCWFCGEALYLEETK